MADQEVQPLAHPYGGRGPLVMGVTWAETAVALILILLRTYTNAVLVKAWKWDYFWAIVTLVLMAFHSSINPRYLTKSRSQVWWLRSC